MRITVKLGGSILEDARARRGILGQVAELAGSGHELVLVHGGGKSLNRRLVQLGIESSFVDGLRVTNAETLAVAVMVLAGEVNKTLVSELGERGCRALGLCGADAWSIRCEPLGGRPDAQPFGFVGKPVSIDSDFFGMLLARRLVPVVSSIALGPDSRLYNVNADQMASICARGTGARILVFLTDVPGLRGANGAVLRNAGRGDIEDLRTKGILSGGMLPKTTSCLEALEGGVESVYVVPGKSPGILTGVVYGKTAEGTQIHGNSN